ncbi:hypothetical protein LTR84_008408 [Exophiala bonariae]|uniref:Uncharacterized protein n=1 Tax=Exophiala bonariae TaxID=1690606 RepID=A0AAV9MXH6_9EURO|nr:hypothetical protein LTR84_008408 [Exophiala bonariae]
MSTESHLRSANKSLPKLPKISIESHRPCTRGDGESCPSPTIRKHDGIPSLVPQNTASRLPQFQQSRRWAKKYGPGPPPPTPPPKERLQQELNTAQEPDDRMLSKREESFEQQRAELKRLPAMLPRIEEPENHGYLDDNSPNPQESNLCPHVASKYWENVKATILTTTRGTTLPKHDLYPQSRRATPTKSRDRAIGRRGTRIPVPAIAGIGFKAKHRRRASSVKRNTTRPSATQGSFVHQDEGAQKENSVRQVPPSPVLSLHDPEKDSRFSKECMDILKNMDFNRDWLLVPTLETSSSSLRIAEQAALSHKNCAQEGNPYEKITIQAALAAEPVTACPNSPELVPHVPHITITSSSTPHFHAHGAQSSAVHLMKDDLSFATLPQRKRSPRSDIPLHKFGSTGPPTGDSRNRSLAEPIVRIPSSASSRHSMKSPMSAMSTDTLTKIEAQVQTRQPSQPSRSHGHLHFHRLSEPKSDGPPSIPPERPLPALPQEASIGLPRLSIDTLRGHSRKLAAHVNPRSSISTIHTLGSIEPSDSVARTSHNVENLVHTPSNQTDILSLKLMAMRNIPSAVSLTSDGSSSSTRSYMKHNISGPRAEKVKEKRLRDLASSKSDINLPDSSGQVIPLLQKQSSSEDVKNNTVTHSPVHKPSYDELDQFPEVPESRPTSLISPMLSRGNSRAQHHQVMHNIHSRQLSKASSNYHPSSRPRQILSQSNIFIVVDTDPVTTRFKAGTMSPAPSIGSLNSCSASPQQKMKHSRCPSNLKDAASIHGSPLKNIRNRASIYSLKSQVSASGKSSHTGVKKHKRPMRSVNRNLSSSSDESNTVVPSLNAKSSKQTMNRRNKRRRWNSNDIGHVKTLEQALDYYRSTIVKQEERLRNQADQIQMMIRVIAPMNRARGVKDPSGLSTLTDYSTPEETHRASRRNTNQRTSDTRTIRASKISLGSPIDKKGQFASKARCQRPNSPGAHSTASGSASANTTDATKASADDASMTDPLDYDHSPTVNIIKPFKPATTKVDCPKPDGSSRLEPRPTTREKPTSQGKASITNMSLHQPPPVAQIIPRGKLPEEMSLLSFSTQARDYLDLSNDHPQHHHTLSKDSGLKYRTLTQIAQDRHSSRRSGGGRPARLRIKSDDSFDSEVENQRNATRLSVNHVLTSTEQMDRAIDQFMHF